LGVPLLVPSFHIPRDPWWLYASQLNRGALTNRIPGLERYDLQLIGMIDDARERLAVRGLNINRKVFLFGFSSSGFFVNRFALLHPDRVKAVAVGAPGACTAPTNAWKGEQLDYPVGIADLQPLIGLPFDHVAARRVPMYFFMGDQDTENDPVPFASCFEPAQGQQIFRLFGANQVLRWPEYEKVYAAADCDSRFVFYPDVGHQLTQAMFDDVRRFFELHRYGPIVLQVRQLGSSELEISWQSDSGVSYQLLRSWSLAEPVWTPLGRPVNGNGDKLCVTDVISPTGHGFYRIHGSMSNLAEYRTVAEPH
jgi:pimeloyl-ACP methyl ester carboxylesterase